MTIAVLGGTGPEGLGIAARLLAAGDDVIIGSRVAERAAAAAATLAAEVPGSRVHGARNPEAASAAELVIVAVATVGVDAVVADEPFATRLARQKVAFVLADYHELETTRRLLGGLFLNGMLGTRTDMVAERPEVVGKVVRTVKRALAWIDKHDAGQMVEALAPVQPEERATLLEVLRRRKNIYAPDGRFSDEQLDTVDRFLHVTEPATKVLSFSVRSCVEARWAGSMP